LIDGSSYGNNNNNNNNTNTVRMDKCTYICTYLTLCRYCLVLPYYIPAQHPVGRYQDTLKTSRSIRWVGGPTPVSRVCCPDPSQTAPTNTHEMVPRSTGTNGICTVGVGVAGRGGESYQCTRIRHMYVHTSVVLLYSTMCIYVYIYMCVCVCVCVYLALPTLYSLGGCCTCS
jgi:hypothetical protein